MILPKDSLVEDVLAIFLFHGVVQNEKYDVRNYTRKHLELDYFISLIKEFTNIGHPLSMDEAVERISTGEPFPPRSFAVTFDDGFENNYRLAAPVLKDMNVPATFYVTTDFIENNTMSWIDRIEYCLENLSAGSLKLPWRDKSLYVKEPEGKISALDEIRFHVKNDAAIDVENFVSSVFEQFGMNPVYQSDDPLDKKMDWRQIDELESDPNFNVGGHMHTHAIMSHLSREDLENEVSKSLKLLRQKAGVGSRHYSYPEGFENSYSEEVISLLKKHGIVCCPTAIGGVNAISEDLFHLKRIMVV